MLREKRKEAISLGALPSFLLFIVRKLDADQGVGERFKEWGAISEDFSKSEGNRIL